MVLVGSQQAFIRAAEGRVRALLGAAEELAAVVRHQTDWRSETIHSGFYPNIYYQLTLMK